MQPLRGHALLFQQLPVLRNYRRRARHREFIEHSLSDHWHWCERIFVMPLRIDIDRTGALPPTDVGIRASRRPQFLAADRVRQGPAGYAVYQGCNVRSTIAKLVEGVVRAESANRSTVFVWCRSAFTDCVRLPTRTGDRNAVGPRLTSDRSRCLAKMVSRS
jgi:hypothetical protein